MPKARIPSVEITIGGETRHLIYGHHALGELEERAAQLPSTCSECGQPKRAHIEAVEESTDAKPRRSVLVCPDADGPRTTYSPCSRIKAVILALWAGLLTETLDSRGRETVRTLSEFQVSRLLDSMEREEVDAVADKILEAQGIAKPPADPPKASETAQPLP